MKELDRVAAEIRGGGAVAFTGAGMSAEAGIPTFRDPGGLWDRFDPETFGTWQGLMREAMERPDGLAAFLAELRRVFAAAHPTPGHMALSRLESAGLLDGVVTQNVDGLHQDAGSSRVLEIHGSFLRLAGTMCEHRSTITRAELVENLDRAIIGLRSSFVASLASVLPPCPSCGRPARPDYVAFGESPQGFDEALRLVRSARVLLVVGTSGEVFPAASLPDAAKAAGGLVVDVGPAGTGVPSDLVVRGEAGKVLPSLVDLVLQGYAGADHGGA